MTHHAATDAQPPVIGLRGLTDPEAALAAFIDDRGTDTSPLAHVLPYPTANNSLTGGGICGIVTAGGFVAGVILVVLVFSLRGCGKKY